MSTLVLAVTLAVAFSFTCSLAEAALYSIPLTTIERMKENGEKKGQLLSEMRSNVNKPITAILTINTIANTVGATVAGAAAIAHFGEVYTGIFAAVFTLLILTLGEIIPKILGVAFAPKIASALVVPLALAIKILAPIIALMNCITGFIKKYLPKTPPCSEADICATAGLSRKAGQINEYEESWVRNVLALDQKHVHEIMTPRTVVFSLPASMRLEDVYADRRFWQFSRIPLYGSDNEDLVGLVERPIITQHLLNGDKNIPLSSLMRKIYFVPETQTLDKLLQAMLKVNVHLFAVVDEYGGLSGVVSLEDVLEEVIGREIVDESDAVADMRALAKSRVKLHLRGQAASKP
ncbi:MAG: CNNM domain-containing protein [Desulfovibrio sp.]|nr:CNNM domain-containing protein [Desulfovibrio sp.]